MIIIPFPVGAGRISTQENPVELFFAKKPSLKKAGTAPALKERTNLIK
jgi:hypothetical protein